VIFEWARRWKLPLDAILELHEIFGIRGVCQNSDKGSEADMSNRVRLEASRHGILLWRNNLGAVHTADGRFIRYGLANDSAALNARIKSSDLIGIQPIEVDGRTIGRFVAIEVKKSGWKFHDTARERAQLKFLELVEMNGGRGFFINDEKLLTRSIVSNNIVKKRW